MRALTRQQHDQRRDHPDQRSSSLSHDGRYPSREPMEKFVIQGGAPLSGELTVAGNKNAALPILAACLLTEEELLLHRCRGSATPRPRSRCSSGSGSRSPGSPTTASGSAPRGVTDDDRRRGALEPDPRLVPARRPAAGPLRRGEDAAAGRRLHRPPPPRRPPRRLQGPRRPGRRRPLDRARARPTAASAPCAIFMDEPSVMGDRERADGRGADRRARRRSPTPPASRTSRTSPGC